MSGVGPKPTWRTLTWREVEVGDVVRVRNRDTFPADLLLLASSLGGQAWVNTKPVDGESDVKLRLAPKPLYVP